ncbi:hypothetical protein GLYMA_18G135700v4 [Glycine max]|nr:hypothetical protein GLYMA_18G135700v4 [Glycine max]KAH1154395.1 hypothetical protein GYH30_049897 [Glycine max]
MPMQTTQYSWSKKLFSLFYLYKCWMDLSKVLDCINNTYISCAMQLCMVDMECVVQGIIETQHVEALEILLQGLCGVQRERLRIHEICLKSGPHLGTVASEVRLLCDLEQAEPSWWCNEGSRRRANFCSG